MGDVFRDRLDASRRNLANVGDGYAVTDDRAFAGFDAVEKVLATDVDLVILATPPAFRPLHLAAAVAAGKHVFMEKPCATDPTGVRSVMESAKSAREKGLGIVAGTQRRHQRSYLECMKRIEDGAIGEIVGGHVYWNQGGLWVHTRQPDYTDMEYQLRNWLYFAWASGDHIVEQHVHNLDVMNWAMGGPPVKAYGMGGRQSRTAPEYGNIYDHFAVEYEFANGARIISQCRQVPGTDGRVDEHLVGTQGTAAPGRRVDGRETYRHDGRRDPDPYVQEHRDLIESIRAGEPLNEAHRLAESTLTAIMGRMSAYSGKVVSWEFALGSTLDLLPGTWEFGELAVDPVAVPGSTPLI
ncbi:MAG: Gfo/Idh/MocA family oxidoreductase, partial [Planctomycetes bacterium]|nr:Gfo/Idh/MocA family oxidoreductase [Planctomycetota bacterium]